jgi:hypothetical protein
MFMRNFVSSSIAMLAMASAVALAQPAADTAWDAGARAADKAYWEAYNRADPDGMNTWLASDVEFYHDRGGKVIGKEALSAVNEGMKSAPVKLRREPVPGTVRFFPMRQGETLYGAIVTGEHRFYARPAGAPETLAGHANFTHLMLLQGKQWRISRIFSYEHVDAPAGKKE